MKHKKKAIAFVTLLFVAAYLAITAQASSAATTTTIPKCNRAEVKIIKPITVANGTASVSFTLTQGCSFDVGLATYDSPTPKYDPATVDQEVPTGHVESHFTDDGITHTLSLPAPTCFYQVDFFLWRYIPHFTTTNQYLGDLVAAQNAGTQPCNTPAATTTTTTAPHVTTTTTVDAPYAGTPDDAPLVTVPASSVSPDGTGSPATLPRTGAGHVMAYVYFGVMLIIFGASLIALGIRARSIRKFNEAGWAHVRSDA